MTVSILLVQIVRLLFFIISFELYLYVNRKKKTNQRFKRLIDIMMWPLFVIFFIINELVRAISYSVIGDTVDGIFWYLSPLAVAILYLYIFRKAEMKNISDKQ